MKRRGHENSHLNGRNGKPKYLGKAGTPKSGPESTAKKPIVNSKKNGEISSEEASGKKNGTLRVETVIEKINPRGGEVIEEIS